ncbi:hypothetical protein ES703_124242 [subsurface metagenome]
MKISAPSALMAQDVWDLLTEYHYSDSLADGANYVPVAKTIVFQASLSGTIDAKDKFRVADSLILADAFIIAEADTKNGITRVIICDGTSTRFMNGTGFVATLTLRGLSMA